MIITTEYKINQSVWVIKYDKIIECYINKITTEQKGKGFANSTNGLVTVAYMLQSVGSDEIEKFVETSKIYTSKQEAANAWLEAQGLSVGIKDK